MTSDLHGYRVILLAAIAAALAIAVAWIVIERLDEPQVRVVMLDAVGADLDAVGRQLTGAGYRVVVRRPKIVVPNTADPSAPAYVIPESVRPFRPGEWTHLIAGQVPAPGVDLGPQADVILIAGVHHGAGPFRPWIESHSAAVLGRGKERCPACHAEEFCSDCHEAVAVETDVGG